MVGFQEECLGLCAVIVERGQVCKLYSSNTLAILDCTHSDVFMFNSLSSVQQENGQQKRVVFVGYTKEFLTEDSEHSACCAVRLRRLGDNQGVLRSAAVNTTLCYTDIVNHE